ncbi:hypothetical protein BVC80_613g3 [Macleaya cordata]|uniref:Uncharacterized protein n=1 Tax=Macleaya cordata TaxID=56857 RepID=A0A200QX84_MACCD|nr:hypothetical protein BVC80_613g3 [Macleaya cordata]
MLVKLEVGLISGKEIIKQPIMPRSVLITTVFQVSLVVFGAMLGIIGGCAFEVGSLSQNRITQALQCILIALLTAGGSILYVMLLRWLLPRLQARGELREKNRVVVAVLIIVLCDPFVDMKSLGPLVVLATLSSMLICVITTGLDYDRTGMTEGLLIGFLKLLLGYVMGSKLGESVICAMVLLLVIISKLTEDTGGANVENLLPISQSTEDAGGANVGKPLPVE